MSIIFYVALTLLSLLLLRWLRWWCMSASLKLRLYGALQICFLSLSL